MLKNNTSGDNSEAPLSTPIERNAQKILLGRPLGVERNAQKDASGKPLEANFAYRYRVKCSKRRFWEAIGSHFCAQVSSQTLKNKSKEALGKCFYRHLSSKTLKNTPQEGSPKYPTSRIKKNMPIYKRETKKIKVKIDNVITGKSQAPGSRFDV